MNVQKIQSNGIEIAYETFGDSGNPPILLVMGLGSQMIAWPDEMCQGLADNGFYTIRFDNRDVGQSTHLHGQTPPSMAEVMLRRKKPPYTIQDMAEDTIGLITALGLESVHLVGASMGGFISQTVAITAPARLRSLTLIMTSTGSRLVGKPKPAIFAAFAKRRQMDDKPSAQQGVVDTMRLIGSKGYAFDEEYMYDLAGRAYDRGHDPAGYLRQVAAVAAQPNRTSSLKRIDIPTLVMHGLHDPLVAPTGGLSLAKSLRNAKFVGYSGMGHDLPRDLWADYVLEITDLARRAEQGRRF